MADQENIKQEYNNATIGLNMDQTVNQIKKGSLTYALNAAVENFDSNSINYQNEEGNELCLVFPDEFVLIGKHFISEKNKHIFFLANPDTDASEIGYMDNNDCIYHTLINAPCLAFDITHPIRKVVHKINNCATEIYWTDGINPRRYLNIDDIPKLLKFGSSLCDPAYTDEVDCNQLLLQPVFATPSLTIFDVVSGGNLIAGTYQFAIQYADALGNPYTSFQSITNPTPIADTFITTVNFNYPVDKSIVISADNLDTTGQFQYFNLAVIKTINAISTVELVGTYYIDNSNIQITYTGQNVAAIQLAIQDIFEKFPYYEIAQDVTATQEILVWSDLSSIDRINYQGIASQIQLQWETWRIPATENYSDELNATNLRSQLRDEIYPYEICFLLANGKQTDGFHIPGRLKNNNENAADVPDTNNDFIGNPDYTIAGVGYSPYWKIYNTASVTGYSPGYSSDPSYKGPYQYGEMAYWESIEEYPCNEAVWGSLAGQKIRHHKFPDVLVSPIIESKMFVDSAHMVMGNDAVFPIGVHVDSVQIAAIIGTSNLTPVQKAEIIGYKILRGDRGTNKSIVAKGILRNVGKYTKDNQDYYYPNYPYNDLADDSFLNARNNAYDDVCTPFTINITKLGPNGYAEVSHTDCTTAKTITTPYFVLGQQDNQCSITKPVMNVGEGLIAYANYDVYSIQSRDTGGFCKGWKAQWLDPLEGLKSHWLSGYPLFEQLTVYTIPGTKPGCIDGCDHCGIRIYFRESVVTDTSCVTSDISDSLPADFDNGRLVFNSPETSFGQPFLANILKLENIMYGKGMAHFVEVKKNAKYKLLTEDAQRQALASADTIGGTDMSAILAAYQAYLTIYLNGMTRQNYAYSFNSIADYNYTADVPNNLGVKQRNLDISRYLIPIVQSVGDNLAINNYQRESSVFLKTEGVNLPFPSDQTSISNKVVDHSRFTISEAGNCANPSNIEDIEVISYYASLKNNVVNQWGQIYSYETIDTGFQRIFADPSTNNTVFGGDTFISRFGFKTKLPFFLDNRVNAPDDSDVFYDQIGNVAYPKYWHSARSVTKDYISTMAGLMPNVISYKAHNFDCPNGDSFLSTLTSTTTSTTSTTQAPGTVVTSNSLMFYDGYFYMFAYGVPYFYCESSYNMDLRQAFNIREGDFYPHVTDDIPDDWVQESWVTIAQDNTYYYNTTFSKQNSENTFSHIPVDWDKPCYTYFPFRAIYSDVQTADAENRVNAWLTYRALSYFDFPQNYGPLTSVDGIQNRAILARFENKSLIYNNLLTIDTSNPQAAYVGNPRLFGGAPPIDFAETDLGYVGSQHKMLLKIPQGQITVDAKRGQIFLISDTQAIDLSAFASGMNRFFTDHLAFEILRYFPTVDVDNNFTGIGLHGVYDSKYDRVIITKLDYIPHLEYIDLIKYDELTHKFYIEEQVTTDIVTKIEIYLNDTAYFCNKSWTVSYHVNAKAWISFHSYLPNWYIGENNFFYSGVNGCCDEIDFLVAVIDNTLDCNFEGGARECDPTTTTTSTTSTSTTSTTSTSSSTTTTTTTASWECYMAGISRENNSETTTTSTTTTTTTAAPTTTTTTTTVAPTTSTTTTTTTTAAPITTTTTTTTTVAPCLVEGYIELSPSTTTTTTTTAQIGCNNVILNGGFEDWIFSEDEEQNVPDHWSLGIKESVIVHSGLYSVLVDYYYWPYQEFTPTNDCMTLKFWYNTEFDNAIFDIGTSDYSLFLQGDGSWGPTYYAFALPNTNGVWTYYEFTFNVTPSVAYLLELGYLEPDGGFVYFDDLELCDSCNSTTTTTTTTMML
jgi:hypothetical protein